MVKKLLLLVVLILASGYLLLPELPFPATPPNTLESTEPGDTETVYRKAYYTNMSREEVMQYYYASMGGWGIKLILPPENAYSVIRDQTRSSYLEQIVHPWRETLYINAFVPIKASDQINIGSTHYLNKVTIHYVPSSPVARLTALGSTLLVSYWLVKAYKHA